MKNHTYIKTGSWSHIKEQSFTIPKTGLMAPGKVFLRDLLQLSSAEISMNVFPPGATMPFSHRHKRNEEIYICLRGTGQFVVDGTVIVMEEGDALRVAPAVERTWRTLGNDDFCFICVQALKGSINSSTIEDGALVSPKYDWEKVPRVKDIELPPPQYSSLAAGSKSGEA